MTQMTLVKSFLTAAVAGGIALSANAQILVEDFEGGTPTWNSTIGSPVLSTDQALSGTQSVFIPTSLDRAIWTTDPISGAFSYTFNMWVDGTAGTRAYGEVRSAGTTQLFAIGNYHASSMDASTFQFRVLAGGTTGWMDFDSEVIQSASNEWVEFNISRDANNVVRFSVNGVLGATITDADYQDVNHFNVGGVAAGTANQPVYFDDISVIPEPSTYAAIFGGLALVGAIVYRRRVSAKK